MPLLPREGSIDKNDTPTGSPLMVIWVIGVVLVTIALSYYLVRGCSEEVVSHRRRVRFTRRFRNAAQSGMLVISFSPPPDATKRRTSKTRRPVLHELNLTNENVAKGLTKREKPLGCSSRTQLLDEQMLRPSDQHRSPNSACCDPFRHRPIVQPQVIARELGLDLPAEVAEVLWPIVMPGRDKQLALGVVNYSIVNKG